MIILHVLGGADNQFFTKIGINPSGVRSAEKNPHFCHLKKTQKREYTYISKSSPPRCHYGSLPGRPKPCQRPSGRNGDPGEALGHVCQMEACSFSESIVFIWLCVLMVRGKTGQKLPKTGKILTQNSVEKKTNL